LLEYKKLFDYIIYFEDENIQYCQWVNVELGEKGTQILPYPKYDNKLLEFIQAVYDSGIMMDDYVIYFKDRIGSSSDVISVIQNTNEFDILRAVLTYYVRQERFQEGLWGKAAEDKIFLTILLKMRDLNLEKKDF